ncbi:MAG TPA: ectonucleotide pyrophosphatase/phosphodiesterase [Vicinamibacterales bacterium]|nr:ectonucleotide pyrophosphatase/phosphodiesterase [Vicinamibacterales bacterium]
MCLRTRFALVCAVVALVLVRVGAQGNDAPHVILISIDGLMPSAYTDPGNAAHTPNLRRLAREGVWADGVVGVLPTVTYPSHTTLITGVEPSVHGIYDNRILDPENRSRGAWFWYASAIKVPTLPMAVRARGLTAAAVTWPVTIGMDLDYLAPEYIGSNHPESLEMLRALSRPRTLLNAAESARGKPFGWPQTDRDRTDLSTFILKTFDPNILLLHLIDLDGAQHNFGPGSPEALQTLSRVDGHVGEILDLVTASGRGGRTHVAVVSDHGFLPVSTQLQPNAAFKQAGLLSVDARNEVATWKAYFHSSGGSGFVFVKDAADRPRVQQLLMQLKKDPAHGIREIWTMEGLRAKGSHPDAAFGVDVVDGFYTGGGHDRLVKPATTKGGHGFDPERPALHASFILAGPAVGKRGSVGVIRMTQIAPTLASILGVTLSPVAAKPLDLSSSAR